MPGDAFLTLGLALALGLLVGMQRQRRADGEALAGVRTFALITVLGALGGLLVPAAGGWLVGAGLIGVASLAIMANVLRARQEPEAPYGLTTEIAMLVMYGVGASLALGQREPAVALGVAVAILLQLKPRLHALAARLTDQDATAILRFALITFIVLPVLPDETYGPYDVLNPHRIWLMVVLVVGLSLAGYIAFRIMGARKGSLISGLLGGLISSTATTASNARLARSAPDASGAALSIILIATAVMYGRVITEITLVAPTHTAALIAPVAAAGGVCALLGLLAWWLIGREGGTMPAPRNPAELRPALIFGALYAAIIFIVAFARDQFGQAGIYGAAAISGLTDMDAITLGSSRLVERGRLEPGDAWRAILIASVSNLVFKAGIVFWLGSRALAVRTAVAFAVLALATLGLVLLWP
ncbi:MAG: MgtC/SapB family protein [Phycisphaeraceae bacterium]|nr:MgtC/SapB family protein [Phycisphaeraceae bacterium]